MDVNRAEPVEAEESPFPWQEVMDLLWRRLGQFTFFFALGRGCGELVRYLFFVFACLACFAVSASAQDRLARIHLGKMLFFEKGLSDDGTVSCATCHDPARNFTDGRPVAIGVRGLAGVRNTPTVLFAAYKPLQFHDGRVTGINAQALEPIQNAVEMGDQSREQVMQRLANSARYRKLFRAAFGDSRVTQARFGLALADFQGTLVARDTPLEKRMKGYTKTLSPEAERGYQLMQRGSCFECHAGARLTDFGLHNNGVSFFLRDSDRGRSDILPDDQETAADQGAFATPTLVGIAQTGPYMHNGALPDLESVVRGYNRGWVREDPRRDARGRVVTVRVKDRFQDPRVRPQGWTAADERAVLRCLTEGTAPEVFPMVKDPYASRR